MQVARYYRLWERVIEMSKPILSPTDVCLMKASWQLSLEYNDNEFDDAVIKAELQHQGIQNIDDDMLLKLIIRMLDLDLLEVQEIGSLYRCAWTCSSSSTIELTIVPYNEALNTDVLTAVTEAVEQFGDLVDVVDD